MRFITVHRGRPRILNGGKGPERAFSIPFRRAISYDAIKSTGRERTFGLRVCRSPCIESETRPVVARMENEAIV